MYKTTRVTSHQSEWLRLTQKMTSVGEDAEKGEPLALLVGTQAGAAAPENSVEGPQEVENRATLQPSNCTTGYLPQRHM